MPKKIEFKAFRDLADYDYGVKGFEVRIQDAIETYLSKHEIDAPWWDYYNGSIFEEVLEIYLLEEKEQNSEILINLHNYYEKVTKEVESRVKDNEPVTHEARNAAILAKHPERAKELEAAQGEVL